MRILFLCHTTIGGGADYERSRQLGRSLSAGGHQVALIASAPKTDLSWYRHVDSSGLTVLAPPDVLPFRLRQAGLSPIDLIGRIGWLTRRDFDVVHLFGHRPVASLPLNWRSRGSQAIHVADWSDRWGTGGLVDQRSWFGRRTLGVLDERWERSSRLGADGLTVVSRHLASLAEVWGVAPDRVLHLGLGVNAERIRPMDQHEARLRLGLPADIPYVFYSGQSRFDWPLAHKVMEELMRRNREVAVLIAGRGSQAARESFDPPMRERTRAYGYVSQSDLSVLLGSADAILLPFPNEPYNLARLPNRLGDSMAAARPVVSNPTGEVGRIIQEEGVGLAVASDPATMAGALVELLADPAGARAMGEKARRVAERRYAWPILAERLVAFYRRLAG